MRFTASVSVPVVAACLIIGCGSEATGESTEDSDGGAASNVPVPRSAFGGDDGGFDAGSLAACATSQAAATLKPVNLVFLYDKSGSMGDKMRSFTCQGGSVKTILCATLTGIPKGQATRYVCSPYGTTQFGVDNAGDLHLLPNGPACPNGTVGSDAAVLCSDPTGCTLVDYFDPAAKWIPVGQAMNGFFADPKSVGLSASLGFFPQSDANGTICSTASYATPSVPMSALPNGTAFRASIAAQSPGGNTPTEVALTGTIGYAKTIAAAKPNEVTAIVLVSDGLPTECGNSNAQAISVVKGVAQSAAADPVTPIKTYVIGVGSNLANLNDIAVGGGTGSATLVSATNPTQTSADFQKALDKIRGQALSCDVPLPPPPDGKTLDINAVNVVVTIGGKENVLSYNKDCAGGSGWHYDDINAPKLVKLCDASCSAIRSDAGGKIAITFGCATKGGVIR